jgi:tetratricopeptide (TPR) repeat protein
VHVSALRKTLGDTSRSPKYIETVPRSGYRFIASVTKGDFDPHALGGRWSLAVLPARPLMPGSEGIGPSIGLAITDALIDRLGRFEHIVVRPTRAIQPYEDAPPSPADIGQALQVDAVIEPRFHQTPDGLTVSAQLVRSRDGVRLWSGHFEHEPRRPEVYEQVGRGRSHLLSASLVEMPKAEAAFQAAIELDPTYAAAHAGLALACCAQAELRAAPVAEAYAKAKAAALRALAMDDTCADAQVALGAVLFLSEWDWIGAERSVTRALEINPNHTDAYLLYGRLLESRGRLDEGLEMKLRALERDPFSPLVHLQISMSYWNQRRYDEAIAWANKTLAIDPRHLLAREFLAGAYWAQGDFDRHMAENIKHAESYGVPAEALEPLKQIYAAGGRAGVVQHALQRACTQPHGVPDFQLALLYGETGDLDAAFRHLGLAMDSHDPCLVQLAVAPQWDNLRGDPRFRQCLARMGLSAV